MEYTVERVRDTKNIVTIIRPILTPEEREKRMKAIKEASVKLIIAEEREKKGREKNDQFPEAHRLAGGTGALP